MKEQLIFNHIDISNEIAISSAVHEMSVGGRSDSVLIRFIDVNGQWDRWKPEAGSIIEYKNEGISTGIMYLYHTLPEENYYSIRAYSMPLSGTLVNSRTWERVHFFQIGEAIAKANGLTFECYGMDDIVYDYLIQKSVTDLRFFHNLCMLERADMIIYDGKLIAAFEPYLESMEPKVEIDTIGAEVDYYDNSFLRYGSAMVTCGQYRGVFKAPKDNNRILIPKDTIHCTSNAEAIRFATGLLRNENKMLRSGSIKDAIMPQFAAGTKVNIKNDKAPSWSGNFFIHKIRHDYGKKKTTLFFREGLEGY